MAEDQQQPAAAADTPPKQARRKRTTITPALETDTSIPVADTVELDRVEQDIVEQDFIEPAIIEPAIVEHAIEVASSSQMQDTEIIDPIRDNLQESDNQNLPDSDFGTQLQAADKQAAADDRRPDGCGYRLKSARESQGMSIQEVCRQLRLSANQIQAIENNQFDLLPQKTIVRGFIRNYARLLKIDPEPILSSYQQMVPQESRSALTVKSNADESVISSTASAIRPGIMIQLSVAAAIVALLGYLYYNHIQPVAVKDTQSLDATQSTELSGDPLPLPTETETTPPTASAAAQTSTVLPASGERQADAAKSQTAPTVASPPATTAGVPINAVAPATLPPVTVPPVTVPPVTVPPVNVANNGGTVQTEGSYSTVVTSPTPADDSNPPQVRIKAMDPIKVSIKFKLSDESWVRVEDKDGKKLFSQILAAGTEQSVTAEKPVNIIVGNIAGTQLYVDGQIFDLAQATKGRVARVHLK